MTGTYQLIGGDISYYTGKARSYLRYKGIPFEEVLSTRDVYMNVILPRTGVAMIPVLLTPEDEAIQDTSDIIDFLETRFPDASVFPDTPRQGTVARLFELYGDEWLVIPAMHYRWNHNEDALILDFGKLSAPDASEEEQRAIGEKTCGPFRGALPALGVSDKSAPAIEASYEQLLEDLDAHFAVHPFVLGTRPSIGDYGLMGPLYAHQYRDPWSGALMKRIAPNVAAWVERMNAPEVGAGEFLADDEVPETLYPVLRRIFAEQFPVLHEMTDALGVWIDEHPGEPVPRAIGKQVLTLTDADGKKVQETCMMRTFPQWMLQRVLDFYDPLTGADRESVDALLDQVDGRQAMAFNLRNRVVRRNNILEAE